MRPWLVFRSHLKLWMTWTPDSLSPDSNLNPLNCPANQTRRNVIHLPLGFPQPTYSSRSLPHKYAHTCVVVSHLRVTFNPSCASSAIHVHKKGEPATSARVRIRHTPVIGCNHGSSRLCSRVFNFLFKKRRKKITAVKERTDVAIFSSLRQTAQPKSFTINSWRLPLLFFHTLRRC